MTDTEQTPKTTPDPEKAEGTPDAKAPATGTGTGDVAELRREAASWRRKLRDTEAERDQLATKLTAARRAEVERALGERLADPNDLLSGTEDLDRFYTEDKLDPEAVKREVDAVLAEKPHWRRQPAPKFDGGPREPAPTDAKPSFGEAVKRAGLG